MNIISSFGAFATGLISSLGYGGLAVGLIVDSAGVPIPSEVLLPLAGALAHQGKFNLAAVIVVATLAQTAGALLAYFLGAGPGLGLVHRYGKYVLFSEHELKKTQKLFDKYGAWLTLAGRCLPGIRTYIGYPAGIARMPLFRFTLASFVGSLIWSTFLALLGYKLANNLHTIDQLLGKFGYVLLILVAVAVVVHLYRTKRKAKITK